MLLGLLAKRRGERRVAVAAVVGAVAVSASAADWPEPTRFAPSAAKLARHLRALEPLHARYNPAERMLREPFSSPGYHTTLTGGMVHPTRSSLNYAVALLDSGREEWRERAEAILRRVIALQDQNPDSRTYGIWPWFLEEPLSRMSPPDWNWADFCGVALLQVALDHRDRLAPEVAALVDEAICHAARSIQRRNVGPAYTNIAIMGSYVTLVAGELYGWEDLLAYGRARWRRFHEFTLSNGGFSEYNSPTYTVVALKELSRILRHVRDAESRRLAEDIYRLAWADVAESFHPPTRQWAGPHSRSYRTLLGADTLAFLDRAIGRRAEDTPPALDEIRLPTPCPAEFHARFLSLTEPREVRRTFQRGEPPVVGTTWLTPEFAVGSVNLGDFWNQRRALVAYWGTAEAPAYLHVRILRNGYDFSAAQFVSAQARGDVLGAVVFATDGGNTHVSLDRLKDGVFTARELRLRFEFGGAARALELPVRPFASGRETVRSGPLHLQLAVPHARFGGETVRWESGGDDRAAWIEGVLYSGPEREFRLGETVPAVVALALRFSPGPEAPPEVRVTADDDRLRLRWNPLRVEVPTRPVSLAELRRQVVTTRD